MKRRYKELDKAFKERYKYWKKIGYKIEISEDKKHIKFANNHEITPCYIDIQNGMTMCYGDYSEYMFRAEVDLTKGISTHYLERKCCCGNVDMYDYDIMQEDVKHEIYELRKQGYHISRKLEKLIKDTFNSYYDGRSGDLDRVTEKIHDEVNLDVEYEWENYTNDDLKLAEELNCFDWKERLYNSLGFGYEPHFVAQLVILQIAHEEVLKGEVEND